MFSFLLLIILAIFAETINQSQIIKSFIMKRILSSIVLSIFVFLCVVAQNQTFNLEPLGQYQKSKSERVDVLVKNGKPVELFDKVSHKRLTLTGDEIIHGKSQATAKCSVTTKKSSKEEVATITLTVIGDPWGPGLGTGTGLQMFIDADAVIVDNFWDYFWVDENYFFDNSEYKIPQNAVYGFTNPQVIHNGTGSVEIPGGVYDFLFLRPWPFVEMYVVTNWAGSDEIAMADNFTFVAGLEYIFTVETPGDVFFQTPEDIKLSDIILPLPSLELTNQEDVSLVLDNNGSETITGDVKLAYKVNNGTEVEESFSITELLPGDDIIYTFNAKANFSAVGFHKVEARVEYAADANPYNNTLVKETKKFELIGLPFNDEFDTPNSMLRWSTIDGNGDGYSWMYDNWFLTDADGGKGCLQVLCQSYGANEYLVTDPIIISEAGIYEMSFYSYALGNDKITILYGKTYNVSEMEVLEVVYPNSSDWEIIEQLIMIDKPGNYFFAFHYFGVYSDDARGVNFDKFNLKQSSITNTYTIVPVKSGCVIIEPSSEIEVLEGEDQTFTFVSELGCLILMVLIDDVINEEALAAGTYTFSNVTANHTIEVVGAHDIYEQEQSNVHLYPNPTNNNVFIKNDTQIIQNIRMYDFSGRLLKEWSPVQSSEIKIDISDFQSGIYLFDIDGITKKMVKQ